MDTKLIGIVGLALALAGCGGGGYGGKKKPMPMPKESTGTFQAGKISGLHYATATRSGETDAAGTFKYLPGETVTFSIGNFVLGAIPGAAAVTPFSLAGGLPPTTELALRRELDLATRIGTPFAKAINIQRLLVALDTDSDPANGITIGAQAGGLAADDLDLDATVAQFAAQLRKRIPDLTGNLPNSEPLALLYRTLGILVPVHAEKRAVSTLPAVPAITPIVTSTDYAASGARASQGIDFNGDEVSDVRSTWQYDALSRITAQSTQSIAVASLPPTSMTVANHYDARGNLIASEEQDDGSAVGAPSYRLLRTLANDDHGFALTDVVDVDNGADGDVDSRRSTGFAFDARHNVTSITLDQDSNVDSLIDDRQTVEASYDAFDRQLELTARTDHDADGTIESSFHDVFEYAGNIAGATRHVEEQDFDNDGVVDTRVVTTFTYDVAGFPLTELNEFDSNGDGVAELISRTTFTYDAQHRILTQDDRVDHDGDGDFEELDRVTNTYDAVGHPVLSVSEFDIVDGVAGFTSQVTSRYGAFGERLEVKTESRLKDAAEFTQINAANFTHVVIADGAKTLAQRYLDDGGVF